MADLIAIFIIIRNFSEILCPYPFLTRKNIINIRKEKIEFFTGTLKKIRKKSIGV